MRASAQLNTNITAWVGEFAMSARLGERTRDSVAAYHLTANENLDSSRIDWNSAGACSGQDPSPVGISACPSRFDQGGMSDRPGDLQCFVAAACLFYK
jgi:hypothetical protein